MSHNNNYQSSVTSQSVSNTSKDTFHTQNISVSNMTENDTQSVSSGKIMTPGAFITSDTSKFLHGHGTIIDPGEEMLRSSQGGVLSQLGSLLMVQSMRQKRYDAHVGDTVLGRVIKLGVDYWSLDIGASQYANLRLSSVNLPSVQRRKTYKDQLQMRKMFLEGDLLVAEVLEARAERRVSLQTRSAKYGKLGRGLLVVVDASLMRRQKQHFWIMDSEYAGIRVILGMNGWVWIDRAPNKNLSQRAKSLAMPDGKRDDSVLQNNTSQDSEHALHSKIARIRNAVSALHKMFIPIFSETILDVLHASRTLETKEMTEQSILPTICASAAQRCRIETSK